MWDARSSLAATIAEEYLLICARVYCYASRNGLIQCDVYLRTSQRQTGNSPNGKYICVLSAIDVDAKLACRYRFLINIFIRLTPYTHGVWKAFWASDETNGDCRHSAHSWEHLITGWSTSNICGTTSIRRGNIFNRWPYEWKMPIFHSKSNRFVA